MTENDESIEYNGATYKIIQVGGGDLSGSRQSNVAVDIGLEIEHIGHLQMRMDSWFM